MSQTAFLSVTPLIASNPVARSIEKARMRKWLLSIQTEMKLLQDGEPCRSLIACVTETLATAIKTLEGWNDPEALGDAMTDAIVACEYMAGLGYVWRAESSELLCDAVDYACQILAGMSPEDKRRAWAWAQAAKAKGVLRSLEAA